ncbi:MAG: 3-isopropylmalate dehydrogenase [Mucinivorans sp.]
MNIKIALLKGDGIGPEVVNEAVKVLDTVAATFGHTIAYTQALTGAAAIDACGEPYPDSTHKICSESDAVLFGAVGDPRFDNDPTAKVRPEQGLLKMRKALGLFANLRPLTIYQGLEDRSPLKAERTAGVDCMFVRELTGGLYFGERGRNATSAWDTCMYTIEEIDRILKVGFDLAMERRGHLMVVDKANVLESSRLWRERAQLMAPSYPKVKVEYMFVDNAAMQIVQRPAYFDVVVTENMFGDILTDLASVVSGSMGLLPSASVGAKVALFEPIHGSWPEAAGRGIANPMATILSAAMLLEHLGLKAEGAAVRKAVAQAIKDGKVTGDLGGLCSTSQVGDYVQSKIN